MTSARKQAGVSWPVRVAAGLAALGGICLVAGLLIATLIADHSSSDSSPSSLVAIGLGGIGFLAVLLGVVLFGGIGLVRLWRRLRPPPPGAPRMAVTPGGGTSGRS
jgi:UDP-N-acetylmuramyl pentapeptide phosphotransferase/UDP-N-acetylglucosamine-1-phosphate transferase